MMMKIFKKFMACLVGIGILMSISATSLSAEVNHKHQEKNDKVIAAGGSAASGPDNGSVLHATAAASDTSDGWALRAEQWELARSGESVLALPVLSRVINAWMLEKQQKIEIQYPGGEEGELWVQQLTDWLVSLGIPSDKMIVIPGSGAGDMIKFDLVK